VRPAKTDLVIFLDHDHGRVEAPKDEVAAQLA
jgi:hypothetical protein